MNYKTAGPVKDDKVRQSGILLHPTSLPSPYGIGDLGKGAYEFADFLEEAGQHLWQILPLGPTGYGDSPYQGFSAFAGQPLLISPDDLVSLKLLTPEDIGTVPDWNPVKVDYGAVIKYKNALLQKAFQNFGHTADIMLLEEYEHFCTANEDWLVDYTLFMAGKDAHEGKCWMEWEDELRDPSPDEKKLWIEKLLEEINFYKFVQFIFFREWYRLKAYANEKNIHIVGDIPIFVSLDSADVWADKELFSLDKTGYPLAVAGVPPDYFSATGQLWGNPLYNWAAHSRSNYKWWVRRVKGQLELVDYLRIDHFRGFEAYWAVPYGDETAMGGQWLKGPGESLFTAIENALGTNIPIFAEDLGIITPEVEKLRDHFYFPGMRVLQFAFNDTGESTFHPHNFTSTGCICYTGTHDNDTTRGWYQTIPEDARGKVRRYMNTDGNEIHWDFIRICLGTIAKYAIFPLQDVLGMDSKARMNIPGEPADNWSWRYEREDLKHEQAGRLKQLTNLFGR